MSEKQSTSPTDGVNLRPILSAYTTNQGQNLLKMTEEKPLLLMFLRHLGCTFCREALSDISKVRADLEAKGTAICFVYMTKAPEGETQADESVFTTYNVDDIPRVGVENTDIYAAFGLEKGTFAKLYGIYVMMRGVHAGVIKGHGLGKAQGDITQMPGVFLLKDGEIIKGYRHKSAASRPKYKKIAGVDGDKN